MNYSQKYTIVQFLEPVDDQNIFSINDWPLHVTLADVFAVKVDETFLEKMSNFLTDERSLSLNAVNNAILGKPGNSIEVTLLEKTPAIQLIHNRIINFLLSEGAIFNSPEFIQEGFLPHSTHQKHAKLNMGQRIHINKLALVDMYVNADWRQRKIIRQFELKV